MKFVIDKNLSPRNASAQGYIYTGDFVYNHNHPEKLSRTFHYALENGCIAGNPRQSEAKEWDEGIVYGLYIPYQKNLSLAPRLPVNYSLTIKNAEELGYCWLEDSVYEPNKGFFGMLNTIMAVFDGGYTLGAPKSRRLKEVGVYMRSEEGLPISDKLPEGKTYFSPSDEPEDPLVLKRTKKN